MLRQLCEDVELLNADELKLQSLQLGFIVLKSAKLLQDPRPVSNFITALGSLNHSTKALTNLLTSTERLTDEDFATAGVGITIGILNLLNKSSPATGKVEDDLLALLRPGGAVFEKCLTKTTIIPAGTGYISTGIANYLGNGALWVNGGSLCPRKPKVASLLDSWSSEIARLGWTTQWDIPTENELGLDKSLLLYYLADEISAKFLLHAPILVRLKYVGKF
jgi:hypothetical protein